MKATLAKPNNAQLLKRAKKALGPLKEWYHQCHQASLTLVQAGVADRVARGACTGVGSQHSWAVTGMDCYDEEATIIDPTLWSYDEEVKGIWIGSISNGLHTPHGFGSIWKWGKPVHWGSQTIELTPKEPLSGTAKVFLKMIGPLDIRGWHTLVTAPVQGWPCGEILCAVADTSELRQLIPIDRLGMLTDRNPGGLYLRKETV